jgi:TRAP-type C4-dicarboxylate transport system substrate-binding protein
MPSVPNMTRPRAASARNVFVLFLILGLAVLPAAAQSRIKLGTLAPRDSSFHRILLAMGEKWRQAPGGGVTLTVYPDGAMGGEADMVRKMRIGQVQAGMLTVVGLAEIDPAVTALQNMPMMFRDLQEVDYIREKLRPNLEKRLLDKGFVVLFWGDAGWIRFFSRQPVVHPADLKKTKLFVWAGDNSQVDLMKSAGYQPVPLETSDILPGLQTGLINAVPTIPYFALSTQLYNQAPHMLALNWAPLVGGTVVTRKVWDSLPPETCAALQKAANDAGAQIKARSRTESDEAVAAMQKRGLIVHAVTPEIEAEWRKTVDAYQDQIRGKIVPADMYDEVRRLLQDYRAGNGKTGR